jgi:ATP-dependent Lon protease
MSTELNKKIRDSFGKLAINKQRLPSSGLPKLGIPAYVAEWILEEIVPGEGVLAPKELETLSSFASQMIPRKNEENVYRNRLLTREAVSILAHLSVDVVINRNREDRFAKVPVLGFKDCLIPDAIIEENENLLKQGMWGIIELASAKEGGIQVVGFEPMQASVNLNAFREKRREFTTDEWRELMLTSCGYNPDVYDVNQQIWILCRLLPLVQKNMHLMELAPKGTGKSFIYENISPRVRLTAGNISPAVLFYNNKTGQPGLLARYDVLVLDEIQYIKFEQPENIVSNLKTYLANGRITRGGLADIPSDCGLVLLANIGLDSDQRPVNDLVINDLPRFMHETAFLDRFKGIIPGWKVPKFHEDCIAKGVGLKADFFSDTMTAMRYETHYDEWVKKRIRFESTMSIRDQNAVVANASGLLKILFPDLRVSRDSFYNFCVFPAVQMRQIVRNQLWKLDEEFHQYDKELKIDLASDDSLWDVEGYKDFSEASFEAGKTNGALRKGEWIAPVEEKEKISVPELIKQGENKSIEFKSSLRWNVRESRVDKKMEEIVLKTVSAFGNAEGGKLLIGVADSGEIRGLTDDYGSLKEGTKDGFEIHLRNLFNEAFGKEFVATHINIQFPVVEGKEICEVDVRKSKTALYCETIEKSGARVKKFYIRSGNSSQELDIEETASYIKYRF